MLDGSVLALKISNIGTNSEHNIVAVEVKNIIYNFFRLNHHQNPYKELI